ncbi:hypothetical protein LINGRAHAP2_LOCUS34462 [Linum grandiflorum]
MSPGLVFQILGKERPIDFMNMKTSFSSMFVHLFLVLLDPHIYI